MAEYIEREKIFPNGVFFVNASNPMTSLDELINRINNIPTADVVEVVHGEWIEGKTLEKCSLCGKKGFPDWRYCPHCGAKMDGKENGDG